MKFLTTFVRVVSIVVCLIGASAATAQGVADPVVNEFVANHTGTDTTEFIEIFGDPSADYSAFTILEIEGDSTGAGTIDGVFPVGTTDGDGYWFTGFLNNEIENGTITLLLVEGFTGSAGDDLDTNDDGVLDVTPWAGVADDVAVSDGGSSDQTYSAVVLTPGFDGVSFTPGGASRIPNGTDTDTVADWMRNDFDGEGLPGFDGSPAPGEALNTPETENLPVSSVGPASINEFVANHTGTDTTEFIEIFGDPSADYSAFTILEIEGDSTGAGTIDGVFPVGTTDGDGYWFTGFLNNEIENGTITLLLVEGFTGSAGDDLDTNDDGVLDVTPWTSVADDVAVTDGGSSDQTYSAVVLAPGFDGVSFTPGGASRIPNGTDTDTVADWMRNDFDGAGLPGFVGSPGPGEAFNTPEIENQAYLPVGAASINEFVANHTGTDDFEFIEIFGDPSTDYSAFTILHIEGDSNAPGTIDGVFPVGTTDGDGYWFTGFLNNEIENGTITLLLVEGFTGSAGDDLDTNDDGVLDVTPWTSVADDVAVTDGGSSDQTYSAVVLAPGFDGVSFTPGGASRIPNGTDTDTVADWMRNDFDGAGLPGFVGSPGPGEAFNTPNTINEEVASLALEIWQIQGSGAASPYEGAAVSTANNIVTAVAERAFFMQTPEARSDGDPLTSDGIYVFTGPAPPVAVGDMVDVIGTVAEYFGLTEISNVVNLTVSSSGNPLPAYQIIDETLPSGDPYDPPELERFEGMLVMAEGIATGPLDRFGDVPVVAKAERSYREPGIMFPGLPGLPVWDGNPEVFKIDIGGLGLPVVPMFTGQTFATQGALGFSYGLYEVFPSFLTVGPEPDVLRPVNPKLPGEFTIASQNLLRLEAGDPDIALRLGKLSWHILDVLGTPDILAVQEIDSIVTLQMLADQIAADEPGVIYTPYLIEGNDISGIDVGFLVLDTITVLDLYQFGEDLTFDFEGEVRTTYDRPPLVLEAEYAGAGEPFPVTVIANHLRSLGGIETDDFPRIKRNEQAVRLSEFIQSLQVAEPNIRLVVTGDFNAFQFTDGYVDVMGQITGNPDPLGALYPASDVVEPDLHNEAFAIPEEERYSYIFNGDAEAFDFMLTSAGIGPWVVGSEYSRGNADASSTLFLDPSTPMRGTDHDGVVLYLFNDADLDGVPNDLDLCSDTVIPESVPTVHLGTNRWALVDDDGVFDTSRPRGRGRGLDRSYTIEDTAGCSCEQIIDELHLGIGHEKFGCTTGAMQDWIRGIDH